MLNADRFDLLDSEERKESSPSFIHISEESLNREAEENEDQDEETVTFDRIRETQSPKISKADSKLRKAQDKTKKIEQNEVESLIEQMSKLSISDSKYGLLYYKAVKLGLLVAQTIQLPDINFSTHIER